MGFPKPNNNEPFSDKPKGEIDWLDPKAVADLISCYVYDALSDDMVEKAFSDEALVAFEKRTAKVIKRVMTTLIKKIAECQEEIINDDGY